MKLRKTVLAFSLLGIITTSYGQTQGTMDKAMATSAEMSADDRPTVAGIAVENKNFSTLAAAVKAADLVGTLSTEGPFTVFAPTNQAFAKLPEGAVDRLLQPENKATLTGVLTYHVVSGIYNAAGIIEAINYHEGTFPLETVNGGRIVLSLSDGNVVLTDVKGNTAKVVIPDVKASNGLIHAIDAVVMP